MGEQDVHQFLVYAVFRAVDFIDEQDYRAHLAAEQRVDLLLRSQIIHGVTVFVAGQHLLRNGSARQLKQALFLRLNALDSIVRQKTEANLSVFVFILIGQASDFAFLERTAFDGDAHAAQILRDALHHLGFADTVTTGHQRRNGEITLIGCQIGEQRTLYQPFCLIDTDHSLTPFSRRNTSSCELRFSFLRQSFLPLVSTISASICE